MKTAMYVKHDLGMVDFGRYAGIPWGRVPKSYLQFLISPECHTTEERKELAREELKRRRVADGQLALFAGLDP